LLDGILPKLVPFLITMLCFFLIKKKNWTPVKCIGLLLAMGIIGAMFGIWAGGGQPLFPVPWLVA
ncbi:MAG: PTS system mannose/fructose/sorbose family transporter subunit IID, partial [Erysipelotrichaceae bacterium]|nr:PTS system mannose/fructose/sorbose family transporter subunit IID [Erysipelotrichaceae bacterium]